MDVVVLVGHCHVPRVEEEHAIPQPPELVSEHAQAAFSVVVARQAVHVAPDRVRPPDEHSHAGVPGEHAPHRARRVSRVQRVDGRVGLGEMHVQVDDDDVTSASGGDPVYDVAGRVLGASVRPAANPGEERVGVREPGEEGSPGAAQVQRLVKAAGFKVTVKVRVRDAAALRGGLVQHPENLTDHADTRGGGIKIIIIRNSYIAPNPTRLAQSTSQFKTRMDIRINT